MVQRKKLPPIASCGLVRQLRPHLESDIRSRVTTVSGHTATDRAWSVAECNDRLGVTTAVERPHAPAECISNRPTIFAVPLW